ncbi:arginase family protein [Ilumatobacter sp.]|uniref:arginase family protein n=1 Tax=Ilumatobacter sp. TaxID=1967498 RepID=UPI003B51813B
MTLRLIGVPTSAGAYGIGQEQAPTALRAAGLINALGPDIDDAGDLTPTPFAPDPTSPTAQNLDTVLAVAHNVRHAVSTAVTANDIPLVIGGDCTITLGVVAGVLDHQPDATVAYFDGDTDLSTPATTRSGILDAMGIAHLLNIDGANQHLATVGATTPLLSGDHLALIGFEDRDLTDDHRTLLDDRGVSLFPAEQLREDPDDTLDRIVDTLGDRPRIVHFDLDAVDSIDCPLAEFPHFNTGVTLDTATQILTRLCDTENLAAVVITETNPLHDPDNLYLPRLVNTISSAVRPYTR